MILLSEESVYPRDDPPRTSGNLGCEECTYRELLPCPRWDPRALDPRLHKAKLDTDPTSAARWPIGGVITSGDPAFVPDRCTSRRGNDTPAIRARASSERFALVRANSRHTGRERKRRDQRRPDSGTGPSYDVSVDSTPRPSRTVDRKRRPVSGIRVTTAQRQATHNGGRGRVYTD